MLNCNWFQGTSKCILSFAEFHTLTFLLFTVFCSCLQFSSLHAYKPNLTWFLRSTNNKARCVNFCSDYLGLRTETSLAKYNFPNGPLEWTVLRGCIRWLFLFLEQWQSHEKKNLKALCGPRSESVRFTEHNIKTWKGLNFYSTGNIVSLASSFLPQLATAVANIGPQLVWTRLLFTSGDIRNTSRCHSMYKTETILSSKESINSQDSSPLYSRLAHMQS